MTHSYEKPAGCSSRPSRGLENSSSGDGEGIIKWEASHRGITVFTQQYIWIWVYICQNS